MVKTWISRGTPREIPWAPLARPPAECTVALLTSGGIAGIEHPFGCTMGRPDDREGQLAVLRATLQALGEM